MSFLKQKWEFRFHCNTLKRQDLWGMTNPGGLSISGGFAAVMKGWPEPLHCLGYSALLLCNGHCSSPLQDKTFEATIVGTETRPHQTPTLPRQWSWTSKTNFDKTHLWWLANFYPYRLLRSLAMQPLATSCPPALGTSHGRPSSPNFPISCLSKGNSHGIGKALPLTSLDLSESWSCL